MPSVNYENFDGVEVMDESTEDDDISGLLRDLVAGLDDRGDFGDNSSELEPCAELLAIQKLVEENNNELYPNCKKYTQLRFLVRLLHLKLLGGWTDRSFNLLLDLLNDALPDGSALPRNFHEAKKLVKSIGIGYRSIHACENHCILYWKDKSDLNACPKCKVSRWKSVRKSLDGKHIYKVPRKVLRKAEMEAAYEEERMARQNAEMLSHNGSNSRPQSESPRSIGHANEANHGAENDDDPDDDENVCDEDQLLASKRSTAPSMENPHQSHQCSPTNVACSAHGELVGKEVILYAMLRSDLPVAKGMIMSTDPNTMVGGQALGKQFCEVIVNIVLKKDAILPRPYAEMSTMADANMMSIAWPYRKLKVSKASRSSLGTAGGSGRNTRRVP